MTDQQGEQKYILIRHGVFEGQGWGREFCVFPVAVNLNQSQKQPKWLPPAQQVLTIEGEMDPQTDRHSPLLPRSSFKTSH